MIPPEVSTSPTWPYVLKFALEMEKKLAKNRHKGNAENWQMAGAKILFRLLRDEVDELAEALDHCVPEDSIKECADVANFAMMIADCVAYDSRITK
jgi:NTP pyrophosphatase (non-canonical NTP hydrolase)